VGPFAIVGSGFFNGIVVVVVRGGRTPTVELVPTVADDETVGDDTADVATEDDATVVATSEVPATGAVDADVVGGTVDGISEVGGATEVETVSEELDPASEEVGSPTDVAAFEFTAEDAFALPRWDRKANDAPPSKARTAERRETRSIKSNYYVRLGLVFAAEDFTHRSVFKHR
jgi:hypothetical protein